MVTSCARRRVRAFAPRLILIVALAGVQAVLPVSALQAPVSEYSIKAGFLTAFTRYATWPESAFASPSDPVVLCVIGHDPFGAVLDRTVEATSARRPLRVRRIERANEVAGCHMLFVPRRDDDREAEWLTTVRSLPMLTVGESGRTVERGGVVAFDVVNAAVTFDVNLRAAADAGVRLDADLLSHARRVYR